MIAASSFMGAMFFASCMAASAPYAMTLYTVRMMRSF